ncbi:Ribosomal lysine N-methyltransferase 4 [Pseudocercospora fuligena]|uniref:Ribosomal lysine N-methyltransferase 4 n=1 Tax=Pseudocercospora fuligena TaxID=685502 RepID=A0A8H6RKF7_9PEZI|nr:Ribosomal lysine N-methyltransferase 4 [Pseudocercospora fuligena]
MDIDDFQSTSDKFLTWLKSTGATISSKIQLADLRDRAAGRGVGMAYQLATEDLAEDEELFSIPRTSILTTETSDLPTAISQELNDPWLSLILAMVFEYLRGTESPFQFYFDVLPENFDTLMFWTEDELQHLQGSAVVEKIGKEGADTTFSEQLIPIIAKHTDIFKTGSRNNQDLLALCHRMGSTIMAYAFDLEKPTSDQSTENVEEWEEDEEQAILPKGMIPLADMLNADADLNNAKLFYEDDKVVMKTIKPVKAGEELFNDFGPLPRADLLRRYGYVTSNYAKYDVVEISSDLIRDRAKEMLKVDENDLYVKWQYAEEQGVLDGAYDIARAGSEEGQFPEELCVFLNLLVSTKAEFEKMAKKDKLPKADLSNEAKKLLRTILVHRYAEYPAETTASEPASGRMQMARQVIDGEKEVIREAIEAVTDANTNKKRTADTVDEEAAAIRTPAKK